MPACQHVSMSACQHVLYTSACLLLKVAGCVRACTTAEEAVARIVTQAFEARGLRDDITAAVGWLGTPPWVAPLIERR